MPPWNQILKNREKYEKFNAFLSKFSEKKLIGQCQCFGFSFESNKENFDFSSFIMG